MTPIEARVIKWRMRDNPTVADDLWLKYCAITWQDGEGHRVEGLLTGRDDDEIRRQFDLVVEKQREAVP